MSNFNKKLFKRLRLNHAYGQLIALIFVPITILASVGTLLVLSETSNAAKKQQRYAAIAILSRYQHTSEQLLHILSTQPARYDHAQTAMLQMFNETDLRRAAITNAQGKPYLLVGSNQQKLPTLRKI